MRRNWVTKHSRYARDEQPEIEGPAPMGGSLLQRLAELHADEHERRQNAKRELARHGYLVRGMKKKPAEKPEARLTWWQRLRKWLGLAGPNSR